MSLTRSFVPTTVAALATAAAVAQGGGGMFRTAGVAQRFLAAALDAPVAVAETASEGGAWGIAVLAAYVVDGQGRDLDTYLRESIFADAPIVTAEPDASDVAGFSTYLDRYRAGLAVEAAAVASL